MHDTSIDLAARVEEVVGYKFLKPELVVEALTHASIAENRLNSNERMEFLGDSILGAVTCEYLFHHYPEYLEGELTKIKSAVVSRRVCAEIAEALGLPELLQLGKGMSTRDKLPSSLAAAVYESMVAAIYLDGGFEPVRQFILKYLEPVIAETAASTHQQNFKSVLQQHAQKHLDELPCYQLLDEKGPDHSKCFQVCVEINGRRYGAAWGSNKKEAEQQAALLALTELGVVEVNGEGQVVLAENVQ